VRDGHRIFQYHAFSNSLLPQTSLTQKKYQRRSLFILAHSSRYAFTQRFVHQVLKTCLKVLTLFFLGLISTVLYPARSRSSNRVQGGHLLHTGPAYHAYCTYAQTKHRLLRACWYYKNPDLRWGRAQYAPVNASRHRRFQGVQSLTRTLFSSSRRIATCTIEFFFPSTVESMFMSTAMPPILVSSE
jgi:hypothetical protein